MSKKQKVNNKKVRVTKSNNDQEIELAHSSPSSSSPSSSSCSLPSRSSSSSSSSSTTTSTTTASGTTERPDIVLVNDENEMSDDEALMRRVDYMIKNAGTIFGQETAPGTSSRPFDNKTEFGSVLPLQVSANDQNFHLINDLFHAIFSTHSSVFFVPPILNPIGTLAYVLSCGDKHTHGSGFKSLSVLCLFSEENADLFDEYTKARHEKDHMWPFCIPLSVMASQQVTADYAQERFPTFNLVIADEEGLRHIDKLSSDDGVEVPCDIIALLEQPYEHGPSAIYHAALATGVCTSAPNADERYFAAEFFRNSGSNIHSYYPERFVREFTCYSKHDEQDSVYDYKLQTLLTKIVGALKCGNDSIISSLEGSDRFGRIETSIATENQLRTALNFASDEHKRLVQSLPLDQQRSREANYNVLIYANDDTGEDIKIMCDMRRIACRFVPSSATVHDARLAVGYMAFKPGKMSVTVLPYSMARQVHPCRVHCLILLHTINNTLDMERAIASAKMSSYEERLDVIHVFSPNGLTGLAFLANMARRYSSARLLRAFCKHFAQKNRTKIYAKEACSETRRLLSHLCRLDCLGIVAIMGETERDSKALVEARKLFFNEATFKKTVQPWFANDRVLMNQI